MEILKSKYDESESLDLIATTITRTLQKTLSQYSYLMRNAGWRLIIDDTIIKSDNSASMKNRFLLDLQSASGGDDAAEAKLQTLWHFPDLSITKPTDKFDLIYKVDTILKARNLENAPIYYTLLEELNASDGTITLSSEVTGWLYSQLKFAPCYGGIRAPYTEHHFNHGQVTTSTGELKIVFSGAIEEYDLFFAATALRTVQNAHRQFRPCHEIIYQLDALRSAPIVRFWLDLLKIKES